jgi:phosphohistidine phosphatase
MQVILFRHGPAGRRDATRWPEDAKRPLSPRGEQRTRAAARGIGRLAGEVTHLATSPLVRAVQSAAALHDEIGAPEPRALEALAPGGGYRRTLEWLRGLPSEAVVVLVGHEPDLGKLAGVLLFGAPAALPIKKAGACAVEFVSEVAPGAGRLKWFLPPRALRRFASRGSKV